MASLSMVLPVKPGKREDVRAFCKATTGEKLAQFEASEKRIGLTREGWYLHPTPMGDFAIVWVEGSDPIAALVSFESRGSPLTCG